jgi:ParB/RepB/Spo0J family partition protein
MDTAVRKEPPGHMADAAIEFVPVSACTPSSTNPRKHFDKAKLAELAESIKLHGVLQPLLVRPVPEKGAAGVKYEIVAGERRWKAAKQADLAHVPVWIRAIGDVQVLELQLTENLQRDDLAPLEEADGYKQLMALKKINADQLADLIGKSRSYVYTRTKLNDLGPDGKKALAEGKIDASRALLIARIPVPELQKQALKGILDENQYGDGPMSYRDAREYIAEHFTLALSGAPFDTKDATLVPKAGACGPCPKRTGNQPDLFGDVKSRDVCIDPVCFQAKRQALAQRRLEQLKAEGRTVITGSAADGIVREARSSYYGEDREPPSARVGGGYQALDARCQDDPKQRTVREVLGKQVVVIEIVQDPKTKQLIEIVKTSVLTEILNDKGVKTAGQERAKQAKQTRKKNEQDEIEEEINRRTVAAIYKKHSGKLDRADLQLVAQELIGRYENYRSEDAGNRINASFDGKPGFRSDLSRKVKSMDAPDLQRLLLLMALANLESTPALRAVAKRLKVNLDKIRKEVTAPPPAAADDE